MATCYSPEWGYFAAIFNVLCASFRMRNKCNQHFCGKFSILHINIVVGEASLSNDLQDQIVIS